MRGEGFLYLVKTKTLDPYQCICVFLGTKQVGTKQEQPILEPYSACMTHLHQVQYWTEVNLISIKCYSTNSN